MVTLYEIPIRDFIRVVKLYAHALKCWKFVAFGFINLWNVYFSGRYDDDRSNFVKMFFMNGGHGARGNGDGPGCLSFPSNVSNQPIEAFEHQVPMLVREKSLIPDSGGAGKYRGGNAQKLVFEVKSKNPMTMTIRHERIKYPPRGLMGGKPGASGPAGLPAGCWPARRPSADQPAARPAEPESGCQAEALPNGRRRGRVIAFSAEPSFSMNF